MLKHGEVNPLNVHGLRQVAHCPPHFECVAFESNVTDTNLSNWIYENLSGRFYIGHTDKNNKRQVIAGFESPGEASYFALILDKLNTWENTLI